MVLAREQRLSALDGLAAAAAHELGTPLATIALVAKELKRELPAKGRVAEDIDLLISQAGRCREILSRLAHRDQPADEILARVTLSAMIEDIVAPLRGPTSPSTSRLPRTAAAARRRTCLRAQSGHHLRARQSHRECRRFRREPGRDRRALDGNRGIAAISDDGPGFAQEIIDRLGDPFVTTRRGYDVDDEGEKGRHEGMGLGFFIAKTLLERSGATVTLANRPLPDMAPSSISWPRSGRCGHRQGGVQGGLAPYKRVYKRHHDRTQFPPTKPSCSSMTTSRF